MYIYIYDTYIYIYIYDVTSNRRHNLMSYRKCLTTAWVDKGVQTIVVSQAKAMPVGGSRGLAEAFECMEP